MRIPSCLKFTIILLIIFIGTACQRYPEAMKVENGFLDLSSWRFQSYGVLKPKGEWAFYWDELISIWNSDTFLDDKIDGYLQVPGNWQQKSVAEITEDNPFGVMVLHLKILNRDKPDESTLTAYIPHIRSAHEIYIRKPGESLTKVSEAGLVGKDLERHKGWFSGATFSFPASGVTDIFINISNFDDRNNQGLYEDFYIGTADQIANIKRVRRQTDFLLIGMVSFAGIFMLMIFVLRRSEMAPFWLGAFSLTFAVRVLVINLYLYEWVNNLHWFNFLFRLNYFTVYFPTIAYIAFLRSVFAKQFSGTIAKICYGVCFSFMVLTFLTDSGVYSRFLVPFFVFLIICFFWVGWGQIRAVVERRDLLSLLALVGALILMGFASIDIFSRIGLINIQNNLQVGLTLNILCMAAIISMHNIRERNRVERLSEKLSQEAEITRNAEDEIRLLNRQLADRVEESTVKLKSIQEEMEVKQHETEMAEITSGTLHNVNNVLNNIKVSAELLRENFEGKFAESFKRANGMLKENEQNLKQFIAEDPKGVKLLEYYLKLDVLLDEEKEKANALLIRIIDKIWSIEEIILSQQRYAMDSRIQDVDPKEVLNDALNMQMGSITKKAIKISKRFSTDKTIKVEKIKLLHVLINLIKNASESMADIYYEKRLLNLEIDQIGQHVQISVTDNGHGISAPNMERLFERGFTTKDEGHGFGLNSSKNYVNEMGGVMKAESLGIGKGARFIVKFPITG